MTHTRSWPPAAVGTDLQIDTIAAPDVGPYDVTDTYMHAGSLGTAAIRRRCMKDLKQACDLTDRPASGVLPPRRDMNLSIALCMLGPANRDLGNR